VGKEHGRKGVEGHDEAHAGLLVFSAVGLCYYWNRKVYRGNQIAVESKLRKGAIGVCGCVRSGVEMWTGA
jgi:hypothetical protein